MYIYIAHQFNSVLLLHNSFLLFSVLSVLAVVGLSPTTARTLNTEKK